MQCWYLPLLLAIISTSSGEAQVTGVNPAASLEQRVRAAITAAVEYMRENYRELNLDAVTGLRISEGTKISVKIIVKRACWKGALISYRKEVSLIITLIVTLIITVIITLIITLIITVITQETEQHALGTVVSICILQNTQIITLLTG